MRTGAWVCAISACAVLLAACATPYERKIPLIRNFGYSELKIDDATYQVRYDGDVRSSKQKVGNYWLYRCAELTKEKGYELFALALPTDDADTGALDAPAALRPAVLQSGRRGHGRAGGYRSRGRLIRTYLIYIPGGTTWHSRAVLRMYHAPLPIEVPAALRAQAVIDALQPYIDSNGTTAAPTRDTLVAAALVVNPAYPTVGARPLQRPIPGAKIQPAPVAPAPAQPPADGKNPTSAGAHLSPTAQHGRGRGHTTPAARPRLPTSVL